MKAKVWASLRRFRSSAYLLRSLAQARWAGGVLEYGEGVRLDVPVRVDGRGRVVIGDDVQLGFRLAPRIGNGAIMLQARGAEAAIVVGAGTVVSNNVSVVCTKGVKIGANGRIGDQVIIYDCDFHEVTPGQRNVSSGKSAAVIIRDNVWLGSRVIVLKGVDIGDNSVVAAGAVVTRSLPANVVAGGVPARIIGTCE